MRKIGFIGNYDKSDLILYVAKILTVLEKRVLIVDATVEQKTKYIIPSINPTLKYVTEFEKIDVAVGFQDYEDIMKYLGISKEKDIEYDIVLLSVDDEKGAKAFNIYETEKKYFITSFDVYGIKKSIEILKNIPNTTMLRKVYFSNEMSDEEDEYLNFMTNSCKVNWNQDIIYFPYITEDLEAIFENQRVEKIKFKKLSIQYKEALAILASDIMNDINQVQVRKAIKIIEKGV